ncbi:MAG: hypothetical protein A2505_02565 [Deltaproteobacteria bacterium RIFOXYD12_FULL_55_16]|nr:MAG: hypothetical protein A2505_02565 [Deltaproteobacteria bacterium RIFOXYD12_FULL_55_16]
MGSEISLSIQVSPVSLFTTNFSRTDSAQKVRQTQEEQQKAQQNTATARDAVLESQNNLLAAQTEEQRAAEQARSAQAEAQKNSQARQPQAIGRMINLLA